MKDLNRETSKECNMDRLAYLASVLKEVGRFDNTSFPGRLILQKTVFILKNMGLNKLNYDFGLYLNGPYSSALANDGYALEEKGLENFGTSLAEKDKKIILNFKNMIKGLENNVIWFEAIGTALFLKLNSPSLSKHEIFDNLKARHRYLGHKDLMDDVWNRLRMFKLVT